MWTYITLVLYGHCLWGASATSTVPVPGRIATIEWQFDNVTWAGTMGVPDPGTILQTSTITSVATVLVTTTIFHTVAAATAGSATCLANTAEARRTHSGTRVCGTCPDTTLSAPPGWPTPLGLSTTGLLPHGETTTGTNMREEDSSYLTARTSSWWAVIGHPAHSVSKAPTNLVTVASPRPTETTPVKPTSAWQHSTPDGFRTIRFNASGSTSGPLWPFMNVSEGNLNATCSVPWGLLANSSVLLNSTALHALSCTNSSESPSDGQNITSTPATSASRISWLPLESNSVLESRIKSAAWSLRKHDRSGYPWVSSLGVGVALAGHSFIWA